MAGYIHVEPVLGNYVHGDGLLGTVPLQPDGQWDAFLPETHQQNENGFEVNDCVTEATINCVETLEIQEYGTNSGWARRFLAKNSGTDIRGGNDPQTVSQSLKNEGCVQSPWYPFTAATFQEFYQALAQNLKTLAIATFSKFDYGHSWVNADQQSMMDALTFSPLSAAGYAWQLDSTTGYYITPPGGVAEHDFMVYGYERNNFWKVRDSYAPFEKKLAWDFKFTGVKRHTLHRQIASTPQGLAWWEVFIELIKKTLNLGDYSFERTLGAQRSPGWSEKRNAWVKEHPNCPLCGGTKKITVHHRFMFHRYPQWELMPYIPWDDFKDMFVGMGIERPENGLVQNYFSLCEGNPSMNCHLKFGHWGNFREKYNPHIDLDCTKWFPRFTAKIMDENL